jgi:CelD/BcsL family acetyltransferase involved in cellulose biosynthesis
MSTSSLPAARSATPPPSRSAEARAQDLASLAALESLRAEWEALWASVPEATPFQHPAWLLPWWRHIGRGTLAAIAVRSPAGELVALASLYLHSEGERRRLFPVGIATTDDLTALVRPGWEEPALQCIAGQLGQRADVDAIECPQQRRGSPLLQLPCPPGWQQQVQACDPHPVLDLLDPDAVPKAMRDNVRHCRSRAARSGSIACETAGQAQVAGFIDALQQLHAQRWAGRGEPGVLQDAAVLAMHREAAPLLQAAGLLRLHALRVEGRIAAVLYCLAHARSAHYYIGGFDPAHAAISPGTLLVAHAIGQARAEGAAHFDFLRGQEPYKYRWGAVDEPMFALRRWRAA